MSIAVCRYQSIKDGSVVVCGQPANATGYCAEHRERLGISPPPPPTSFASCYVVPPIKCPACGHVFETQPPNAGSAA